MTHFARPAALASALKSAEWEIFLWIHLVIGDFRLALASSGPVKALRAVL